MKEILIISYFYPPCSLTAAQRPAGWVKHFHKFGYKPIVITRHWDIVIQKPEDQLKSAGQKLYIDTTSTSEIHYLPYTASLRDKFYNSNNLFLKKCSKLFTFSNSILENFSNSSIPFSNFYSYADNLLSSRSFNALIITGNPFIQFRFGYLLNKKFNIPWIADYRDDWTTSEIITQSGILNKFIQQIQKIAEKKWVNSAAFITSVSPVYTKRISDFVKVPGYTILNGFDILHNKSTELDFSRFIITYNGTLYATQDVEGFLSAVLKCISVYSSVIDIQVCFPGVAFDPIQLKRIQKLIYGYEDFFYLTNRIPKKEVLRIQQQSDLLLMLTHKGTKGIPSSKLYEYLSLQKPIVCFPSDFDIVEQTLKEIGIESIVNTEEDLYDYLSKCIRDKIDEKGVSFEFDYNQILHFSQEQQVLELATLIREKAE